MASVQVFNKSGEKAGELPVPAAFNAPIRADIVQFVHTNMNKNHRQAYAVSPYAGVMCSAESWGPGRAVARNPRKHGGIGAYANFVRGGHMYSPLTTQRRLHRKINKNMRRFAVASAIAGSALPQLAEAHGHRVAAIKAFPVVVDCGEVNKTKDAAMILSKLGCSADLEAVKASKTIRAGTGKLRNRRYTQKLGPLVVFGEENCEKAFRNIPGVSCCHVSRLNLLQLAPGAKIGRLVIWTKSAFAGLNEVYANKTGYKLPVSIVKTTDMKRYEQSQALSCAAKPRITKRLCEKKVNPFVCAKAMARLNPALVK
ncbi:Ribosomal protein L4 [Spironucleus salmonicida]|uniref:Large ribosomal subunit protein uL4 n=1 Tax=Spironucleus salmonicida TaxID=348837 RepID=V6LLG6_9EUKA|nr:Ribosomal protein L4 [Spironucleus salmonicida]|eukprot:EST41529.1 Ribosomal protein L4 [Spironucleus salmonicida]